MKIIKNTEPITVEHPVFALFGQPGIGKSSLGYSTRSPLALDFDQGAHRAANRGDTLQIGTWADVDELMADAAALEPYKTFSIDTVGRCLDLMTTDIIAKNPKAGNGGGSLSIQGWGTLKSRFRLWIVQMRAQGKDVMLIAHDKEEKDGDVRVVRPDIPGGSYAEVMKVADFVGYVYMAGKNRVLDFNPTDRWVGKNPAGWAPMVLPPIDKAQTFMADLFDKGREALGGISEASAKVAQQVDDWRAAVDAHTTPEDCTRAIDEAGKLPKVAQAQAKKLLLDRAKALGFRFDTTAKVFVAPTPATQSEPTGTAA